MDAPLTVRFRWTESEFLAAHALYVRSRFGRVLDIVSVSILVLSVLIAVLMADTRAGLVQGVLLVAFALFVVWFRGPGVRWLVRARLRRRKDRDREIVMEFGSDPFHLRTEDLAQSDVKWEAVARAVLAPEGALIFLTARQYLYVSGSGFADVAARERFDVLVRERCADVKQLD